MPEDNLGQETGNQDPPVGNPAAQAAGQEVIDWRGSWDDDLKGHPSMDKFKDSASLGRSYIELENKLGKDKVTIPGENATKEDWAAYYKAGGRPDSVDGYSFEGIQIPEFYSGDEITAFKAKAHELGISSTQAKQLLEWNVKMNTTSMDNLKNQQNNMIEASTAQLKEDWGAEYDSNKALASRAFKTFGGEQSADFLNKYGNDPIVIRTFARIGKAISEDMITGEAPALTPSPAAAKAEIDAIMGNLDGPYYNRDHPEHEAMLRKVEGLFKVSAQTAS